MSLSCCFFDGIITLTTSKYDVHLLENNTNNDYTLSYSSSTASPVCEICTCLALTFTAFAVWWISISHTFEFQVHTGTWKFKYVLIISSSYLQLKIRTFKHKYFLTLHCPLLEGDNTLFVQWRKSCSSPRMGLHNLPFTERNRTAEWNKWNHFAMQQHFMTASTA